MTSETAITIVDAGVFTWWLVDVVMQRRAHRREQREADAYWRQADWRRRVELRQRRRPDRGPSRSA